jgi:hypothetical protein
MNTANPLPGAPGRKNDSGKERWDLLPWDQVTDVVGVLTFGAGKYADDNWKVVLEPRKRYSAAALRHITSRLRGERLDPETGRPHLAHAVCCLLFWMWFDAQEGVP